MVYLESFIWAEIVIAVHLAGLLAIVHVFMVGRTSEGSIAWCITLITFPYASLPLYLIFGRKRFRGYVKARRLGGVRIKALTRPNSAMAIKSSLLA